MNALVPIIPTRRRADHQAKAWSLLGWVLVMVSVVAVNVGRRLARVYGPIASVVAFFVGMASGRAGARCLLHAKRLRAPNAPDMLARDPRPPVVYFRPFSADDEASRQIVYTSWNTHEEQLAMAMRDIGPFVAFGIPQESLPRVGAARLYMHDSRWQVSARELMARAAIVLLRIGRGPSFWWEFTTAVRTMAPQKIVLLVPRDEALYREFRTSSASWLPSALPSIRGWHKKKWFRGGIKALIFFDAAWSPSVVDVQALRIPLLHYAPHMPLATVLQTAFRPICENAGLRWKQPEVNRRKIVVLASFALLLACIAVELVLLAG